MILQFSHRIIGVGNKLQKIKYTDEIEKIEYKIKYKYKIKVGT